jgi:hypothetical protein
MVRLSKWQSIWQRLIVAGLLQARRRSVALGLMASVPARRQDGRQVSGDYSNSPYGSASAPRILSRIATCCPAMPEILSPIARCNQIPSMSDRSSNRFSRAPTSGCAEQGAMRIRFSLLSHPPGMTGGRWRCWTTQSAFSARASQPSSKRTSCAWPSSRSVGRILGSSSCNCPSSFLLASL